MLSAELHAVILEHIRASALSKAAHVQYTAQKCFHLRERMLQSASGCREEAQSLSGWLNRQYRLMNQLSKRAEETDSCTGPRQQLLKLTREQYEHTGYLQQQLSGVASGLGQAADNLLFALLKTQHYSWRDRLYVAILTEHMDEIMEDERECLLGRWIHGEGMRRFRMLPGFRELDNCHHRLHSESQALFGRKLHRLSPGELRDILWQTEHASQHLIAALDALDERVGLLYLQRE